MSNATETATAEYTSAYQLLDAILTKAGFSVKDRQEKLGPVWDALSMATAHAQTDRDIRKDSGLWDSLQRIADAG